MHVHANFADWPSGSLIMIREGSDTRRPHPAKCLRLRPQRSMSDMLGLPMPPTCERPPLSLSPPGCIGGWVSGLPPPVWGLCVMGRYAHPPSPKKPGLLAGEGVLECPLVDAATALMSANASAPIVGALSIC